MKVLQKAKALFVHFNDSGVIYCHWKSNEHLLEGLAGLTDLDVLVEKEQRDLASGILERNGYIRLSSQYGSRYPGVEDWIACDEEEGALIHIHLHYEIVTGHAGLKEFNLPWRELALSTRVLNEEYQVYMTDPNLEIVLLLTRIGLKATARTRLRAMLGRYALSKDDVKELEYLNRRIDLKAAASIAGPYYGDRTEELLSLHECSEYKSEWILKLMAVTNQKMKKWSRFRPVPLAILKKHYAFTLFLRRALKKLFKIRLVSKKCLPAGSDVSIAIVGQDGAGKSTVIRDLHAWLSWKLDVQQYYMGCGDGYDSPVKRLMVFCSAKLKNKPLALLLSILHFLLVARHVKRNIRSAKAFSEKGSVILFDRYPQTQYFGINDGPKIREITHRHQLPSAALAITKKLADYEEKCYALAAGTAPSAVIKLVLPPEESIRRKPGESMEDVTKKHQIISDLAFPGSETLTVDATMDYAEETTMIRNAIWRIIEQKASACRDRRG